ncbi:MAG: hypothetical protein LBN20_02015 [Endomicrobium sp.]|nr:hypothetical protein [Endomicrobium sp.]
MIFRHAPLIPAVIAVHLCLFKILFNPLNKPSHSKNISIIILPIKTIAIVFITEGYAPRASINNISAIIMKEIFFILCCSDDTFPQRIKAIIINNIVEMTPIIELLYHILANK